MLKRQCGIRGGERNAQRKQKHRSRVLTLAKNVSPVGGPQSDSPESRAVYALKGLLTYTAVRISLSEMDAPQSSVDTLKEHAYKHGLKDGTTWLRQLLEFDPSHDSFIPIAARNAIAKRAEYVEHGFDFEKMQHITRECVSLACLRPTIYMFVDFGPCFLCACFPFLMFRLLPTCGLLQAACTARAPDQACLHGTTIA